MNAIHSITPTPVVLSEAFWPLFLTCRVMVRFVGAYICFGLTDEQNRHLIVYAHDTARSLSPPTPEALLLAFPFKNQRGQQYKGPHDLPISWQEIGSVHNVLCTRFTQGTRQVSLLVPSTQAIMKSPEQWVFVQWSRPDARQVAHLFLTVGESRVHVIQKNALDMRVLVRLQHGERLSLSSAGFHYRGQSGMNFVLPVGAESCTA